MSKGKLAKFADMASYPHVFECPMGRLEGESSNAIPAKDSQLSTPNFQLSTFNSQLSTFNFQLKGRWHSDFFHNDNPIVLELGCGRGEYTVGLARRYPERNFIGVDIKGARMWSGATESLKEGLKNVAFLRTNIEIIDRFFAPGEVQEIWLTFSDPQMKKATKRLTSSYFLERYRHFLVDGGIIHLKTDSQFLFTYTKYIAEVNRLPVEACTEDLYSPACEGSEASGFQESSIEQSPSSPAEEGGSFSLSIKTYYEQQWLARGLTIKYLRFHLPALGSLQEPDVEIPLDEYRSYNREKRSGLTTSK